MFAPTTFLSYLHNEIASGGEISYCYYSGIAIVSMYDYCVLFLMFANFVVVLDYMCSCSKTSNLLLLRLNNTIYSVILTRTRAGIIFFSFFSYEFDSFDKNNHFY